MAMEQELFLDTVSGHLVLEYSTSFLHQLASHMVPLGRYAFTKIKLASHDLLHCVVNWSLVTRRLSNVTR